MSRNAQYAQKKMVPNIMTLALCKLGNKLLFVAHPTIKMVTNYSPLCQLEFF